MKEWIKPWAWLGTVMLAGCAAKPALVRPSAQQLQSVTPMTVDLVIEQDALEARSSYNFIGVNVINTGTVPIAVGAAGGALGMLIVNGAQKAAAEQFASVHLAPMLPVLERFDARAAIAASLRDRMAREPDLFGGLVVNKKATPSASQGQALLQASYAMTPDFGAVLVSAEVTLRAAGAAAPIYHNRLTYQSAGLTLQPKTQEDIDMLVRAENARYAALDVDGAIDKANEAMASHDPSAGVMRSRIVSEQQEHKVRLKEARSTTWGASDRATRLAQRWTENDAAALKQAIASGGAELAHMLALDLRTQREAGAMAGQALLYEDDHRRIESRPDGSLVSLASDDHAPGSGAPAMVTVPVSLPARTR